MLKVVWMSPESAFCSIGALTAASVVRKTSMVAILGWIMPLPLAMPPRWQSFPPSSNSTATSFFFVSVVMMALQASPLPSGESSATSGGIPDAMGAMGSGCPMTPVEATTTSFAAIPSASARRLLMVSAISMPSALQVLAFPLLQITA